MSQQNEEVKVKVKDVKSMKGVPSGASLTKRVKVKA